MFLWCSRLHSLALSVRVFVKKIICTQRKKVFRFKGRPVCYYSSSDNFILRGGCLKDAVSVSFIKQFPLKLAPSSTISWDVLRSPLRTEVFSRTVLPDTLMIPSTLPPIIMFLALIVPVIDPDEPRVIVSVEVSSPFTRPSIRIECLRISFPSNSESGPRMVESSPIPDLISFPLAKTWYA